uniref:DUF3593 domain-containing protein n=1 Tax=Araucaria cunninghamii TaxID=56994 RepID=A0A0D6RA56_ARACU
MVMAMAVSWTTSSLCQPLNSYSRLHSHCSVGRENFNVNICDGLMEVESSRRRIREIGGKREGRAGAVVDPWSVNMDVDSQSIASQLFAVSLFPYLGFLYFITKSKSAPSLTVFGFYFLLAFVGATIPAGIYAKLHYGTSLSNVDWLHGSAESFLTLTNLFIVLGLREGLRKEERKIMLGVSGKKSLEDKEKSSV